MTELPLTAAQRGILDAQLLWPGNPAFVLGEYLELRGVDAERWAAAVRLMVADTEAQRVRLIGSGADVRQRVEEPGAVPVETADLTGTADAPTAAHTLMRADHDTPVDPFDGPTTRHLVVKIAPGQVFWYHRAHHMALDGYGFALCARRVAEHYLRLDAMAFECEALPDKGVRNGSAIRTLPDVIAEDTAYRGSARQDIDRQFWHALLTDDTAPVLTDRPRMPAAHRLRTRRPLTRWQPGAGKRYGAAELILAAVAVYLSRRTGAENVVLGVPMMNRMGSVAATVPAMVLNAIALPVRVAPDRILDELAGDIGATLRSTRPHARYRHEDLRRELGRIGGHRRLFGPVVNIMPFDYDLGLPGVEVRAHNLTAGPVEDLAVNVYLRSGAAELCLDANPGSYSADELEKHADALVTLIDRVATAPESTAGQIGRRVEPVQTPTLGSAPNPLRLMKAHAHADSSAPALVDAATGVTLDRGELLRLALDRARQLRESGVSAGDLVALAPGAQAADVITILGIQLVGAGHVALDADLPAADRRELVTALAPAVVVHGDGAADFTNEISATIPTLRFADHSVWEPVPPGSSGIGWRTANPTLPQGNHDFGSGERTRVAYVVFTSGSSGRPKGVVVDHGALCAFVGDAVDRYGWDSSDRVLQFGPLHADTSIEEIFVALAAGASVVTLAAGQRRSIAEIVTAAHEYAITVLDLPTALWHELAIAVCAGSVVLPETVRQIVIGGEEVSAELVARWQRHSPVTLVNSYGPSEATVVCAAGRIDMELASGQSVPLGALFPSVGAALLIDELDPDDGPETDGGRVGQLCIYGPTLARGYLPDPHGPTGFRSLPLSDTVVDAFHTGDRVRVRTDGQLEFLGRIDDLIKLGGRRVHTGTIEDALRQVPGISDALVARSGPLSLAAWARLGTGAAPDWETAARAHLARTLPREWIPARFTTVDELPRNRNFKVDRNFAEGGNLTAADASGSPTTDAPESSVDRVLAVLREVLGDPGLAADADFFGCGGTSMQTIAVANRLSSALGTSVPVEAVFEHPSALALTAHLTGREDPESAAAPLISDGTTLLAGLTTTARTCESTEPPRVLLTGGTGFFGAYLLDALLRDIDAEILVPVRADSDAAAVDRLLRAVDATDAEAAVTHALEIGRLIAVRGDCTATGLGVAPERLTGLAHIVHSAAVISPLRTYAGLRTANVVATAEVARLAAAHGAGVTFVSTITASGPGGALGDPARIPTGYAQSKCVAEHVIAEAAGRTGLSATIARLGRILPSPGDRRTERRDFLLSVDAAVRALGSIPAVTLREPMTRAEDAATVVAATVAEPRAGTRVLDLIGTGQVDVRDVLAAAHDLPLLPLPEWRENLCSTTDLDAGLRQAVTVWCDIQLAGFDRDWRSDHAVALPGLSPADVAGLLGLGGG